MFNKIGSTFTISFFDDMSEIVKFRFFKSFIIVHVLTHSFRQFFKRDLLNFVGRQTERRKIYKRI